MKYKAAGAISLVAAFLILTGLLLVNTGHETDRYHQHLEAESKVKCDCAEDVFCTHLPIIDVRTDNENGFAGAEEAADLTADIRVIDNYGRYNHLTDEAQIESRARMAVRGRMSRLFDKKGYSLNLVTESGENNPQPLLRLPAHHEWVLHGPFLDKTLIRNYLSYNILGEMMEYSPNVSFCEMFINGEYEGVYLLVETICAGKDGARLDMSVDKDKGIYDGYVLRLDLGSSTDIKNIETFTHYARISKNIINIEYPGTSNLTPEIAEKISQDFSQFEKNLYSFDYDDEKYGYKKLIEVSSFADYFIFNEFSRNYDAGSLSTYIYKDKSGRFKLCGWDFNSAFDNYPEELPEQNFQLHEINWFIMCIMDEDFTEEIIKRYRKYRETVLDTCYLENYIDSTIDYLGPAIERNYQRWGYSFEPEADILSPASRNPRSYEEAVDDLKDSIRTRGAWLDENIETLRKYSAESAHKKYEHDAN